VAAFMLRALSADCLLNQLGVHKRIWSASELQRRSTKVTVSMLITRSAGSSSGRVQGFQDSKEIDVASPMASLDHVIIDSAIHPAGMDDNLSTVDQTGKEVERQHCVRACKDIHG
jgi:hypothetical protein